MWCQTGCLPPTPVSSLTVDGSSLIVVGENEQVKLLNISSLALKISRPVRDIHWYRSY